MTTLLLFVGVSVFPVLLFRAVWRVGWWVAVVWMVISWGFAVVAFGGVSVTERLTIGWE
jgi:hypothetical protein